LSFAEASDRVSTVLGMYKCGSEIKYKWKNTVAVKSSTNGRTLWQLNVYRLYYKEDNCG